MKITKATKQSRNAKPAATSTQKCNTCIFMGGRIHNKLLCTYYNKEINVKDYGCCRWVHGKKIL